MADAHPLSIDDLVRKGETVPSSLGQIETFYGKRDGASVRVRSSRPILGGYIPAHVAVEFGLHDVVSVEFFDDTLSRRVTLDVGAGFRIADAPLATEAAFSQASLKVALHSRLALNFEQLARSPAMRSVGGLMEAVADGKVSTILAQIQDAFRACGLDGTSVTVTPRAAIRQRNFEFQTAPRKVQTSDRGQVSVTISLFIDLVPDPERQTTLAANTVPLLADSGQRSVKSSVTAEAFDVLEATWRRHDYETDPDRIEVKLAEEITRFAGRHFGWKVRKLGLKVESEATPTPNVAPLEFRETYPLAGRVKTIVLSHRVTYAITDLHLLDRAQEGASAIVERLLKDWVRRQVGAATEAKLRRALFVDQDSPDNALSRATLADRELGTALDGYGLAISTLEVLHEVDVEIPAASTYRHAPALGYLITGSKRRIVIEHKIIWRVGNDSDSRSKFAAMGALSVSAFEDFLNNQCRILTEGWLKDKRFVEILFDFFGGEDLALADLETCVRQNLEALCSPYGVEISAVTTVNDRIPEALYVTGKDITVTLTSLSLGQDNQKLEIGAMLKRVVVDPNKSARFAQYVASPDDRSVEDEVKDEILSILAGKVGGLTLAQFLQSNWGDGDDGSAAQDLKQEIIRALDDRFGLTVLDEDISFPTGSSSILDLWRSVKGQTRAQPISTQPNEYGSPDQRSPVQLTVPWTVRGLADAETSANNLVDVLRSNASAEDILESVARTVNAAAMGFVNVIYREVLEPGVFESYTLPELLAQCITEEVARSTGILIDVPHRQINTDLVARTSDDQAQVMREQIMKLIDQRTAIEANPEFGEDEVEQVKQHDRAIERLERRLKDQSRGASPDGAATQLAIADTAMRIEKFIIGRSYSRVDVKLIEDMSRGRGSDDEPGSSEGDD